MYPGTSYYEPIDPEGSATSGSSSQNHVGIGIGTGIGSGNNLIGAEEPVLTAREWQLLLAGENYQIKFIKLVPANCG